MLLSELTEALAAYLTTNKALWTEEDITVNAELDAYTNQVPSMLVYVQPQAVQPIIETNMQRGNHNSNVELLVVSLILAKQFTEENTGVGVANWTTEVKPLINTWQRCQEVLMKYQEPSLTLANVEPSPPEPIQEDYRNYAVMTVFSYEQKVCDSAHELPSLLTVSNEGSVLQRAKDSIRSPG